MHFISFSGKHCLVWTCEVIWSCEVPQMLCSYCSEEPVMFLSGSKLQRDWKFWTDTAVSSLLLLFLIDSSSTMFAFQMQKKKVQCLFESSEINISFINMISSLCQLLNNVEHKGHFEFSYNC